MNRLLLIAALALAPLATRAGGYFVPNVNPRDLSMGGALVADQDSAAATYANAAALARLSDGLHLSLADSMIYFRSTWSDPAGQRGDVSTVKKAIWPPALYASWANGLSNGMRYGVGAGFNVPGGGFVFWPRDWPGASEITDVDRRVHAGYLNFAFQPIPMARLAAGVVYYRTTEYLRLSPPPVRYAELGVGGDAWSYQLAFEADPLPGLRVGFDYKHQGVQKLTGKVHFADPLPQLGGLGLDQDATHVLTYPNVLQVGAAYRGIPKLAIALAYTFERFKPSYAADVFALSAAPAIVVERNYRNNHVFRLGAEWEAAARLKLRAGLLRDRSPTPSARMSPTIPDAPVWGTSIGVGYAFLPNLTANATWFHAFYDKVTTDPRFTFPGRYDTAADIVALGFTYDWAR